MRSGYLIFLKAYSGFQVMSWVTWFMFGSHGERQATPESTAIQCRFLPLSINIIGFRFDPIKKVLLVSCAYDYTNRETLDKAPFHLVPSNLSLRKEMESCS